MKKLNGNNCTAKFREHWLCCLSGLWPYGKMMTSHMSSYVQKRINSYFLHTFYMGENWQNPTGEKMGCNALLQVAMLTKKASVNAGEGKY